MDTKQPIGVRLASGGFLIISIIFFLISLPFIKWGGIFMTLFGFLLIAIAFQIRKNNKIMVCLAWISTFILAALIGVVSYLELFLNKYNPGQYYVNNIELYCITFLLVELALLTYTLFSTKNKSSWSISSVLLVIIFLVLAYLTLGPNQIIFHEYVYPSIRDYNDLKSCQATGQSPYGDCGSFINLNR